MFYLNTFWSVCLLVTEILPYIYWWLQVDLSLCVLLFNLAREVTSIFSDPYNAYE